MVELEIPDAKLWNAEHPNLYLAEVTLYSGGKAVDTVTESFGLRAVSYTHLDVYKRQYRNSVCGAARRNAPSILYASG